MSLIIKLSSPTLQNFENYEKITNKNIMLKMSMKWMSCQWMSMKNIKFSKKQNICKRTLPGVYVYKISSNHFEKLLSFDILKVKNGHFTCCFQGYPYFPDFQSFSDWGCSKSVLGSLLCSWWKYDLKHVTCHLNITCSAWPFLGLMTLNDLGHKYTLWKLRIIFLKVQDTIHG